MLYGYTTYQIQKIRRSSMIFEDIQWKAKISLTAAPFFLTLIPPKNKGPQETPKV